MFQFYLLSILFNTLTGLILISYNSSNKSEIALDDSVSDFLEESDEALEEKAGKKSKKSSAKSAAKSKIAELSSLSNSSLSKNEILGNQTFQLVVGILTILTGIIKLFVVVKSGVKVFADFFPAVIGIYAGISVILAYVVKKSSNDTLPETVKTIFLKYSTVIGISAIAVAVLHFIFPGALFL